MDQIRAANARDVFSQIAPGLGGGSGGLQGAMNILRGSLIATRPSPLAATALAVAASPRLGGVAGRGNPRHSKGSISLGGKNCTNRRVQSIKFRKIILGAKT